MKYRPFGKTGVEVSEVGLGAWPLGGKTFVAGSPITYGDVPEKEAVRIVESALNLGINLIDTADSYGLGRSERVIGKAIQGRRDRVFIATKACWVPDQEEIFMRDVSYHNLLATCDRSLKRLGTDHIDFFQVHDGPQDEGEVETFTRVFAELKKSGKARFCGASVASQCEEGVRLIRWGSCDGIQLYYNILLRGAERELLPLCREHGIGVLVAVPFAQGILTGKYHPESEFGPDDVRSRNKNEMVERIRKAEHLRFLDRPPAQTMAQAALRFCLAHPAVTAVIPGARNVEQLKANASASGTLLSEKDMQEISKLYPPQGVSAGMTAFRR